MKTNAWVTIIPWLTAIVAALFYIGGRMGVIGNETIYAAGAIFFVGVIAHILLAIFLKYPNCGKRPTVQGFRHVHPDANKKWGMDGWAVVILDVAFSGKFRCIHCGTEYRV